MDTRFLPNHAGADIVHVSPEHHYPLGTVTTAGRRQELLSWAAEATDHYIIEDDYDCEFRYSTKSIPALQSMDLSHRIIYMNTFSPPAGLCDVVTKGGPIMGIYAVTGGSHGIGAKTVELLKKEGHEVISAG